MKNTIYLFLLVFAIYSCDKSKNEELDSKSNEEIKKQEIDSVKNLVRTIFDEVWSDLDTTKIEKYHTKDFLLLENGEIWNNDSIKNSLKRERKNVEEEQYKRINKIDFIRAVHNEGSIWVAYDNHAFLVKGLDTLVTLHWLESAIAIKDTTRWKLQQLHSTYVFDYEL